MLYSQTSCFQLSISISILFLFLFTIPQKPYALSSIQCLSCHEDMVNNKLSKTYVHVPFLEKECILCHVVNNPEAGVKPKRFEWPSKGRKLGASLKPESEHWFSFSPKLVHKALFIEVSGDGGESLRITENAPQMSRLKKIENDQTLPKISNVVVDNIVRRGLTSATITWTTDELSDSSVIYGVKQLNNTSNIDKQFTRKHMVTLFGLKAKTTYYFSTISHDIYGNRAVSNTYSFSTAETIGTPKSKMSSIVPSVDKIDVQKKIYRFREKILLNVTANLPVKVSVQSYIKTKSVEQPASADKRYNKLPEMHPTLANRWDTTTSICGSCHQDISKSSSHPINVPPKKGMMIPADYITLSDGRLTCMTCHEHHASDNEHRMVRYPKRKLCRGCHPRMP